MFAIPEKFEFLRDRIEKTLKPTNQIHYIPGKTKPWESKLGGCPYMKDTQEYPMDNQGKPMMFLAQINFEEMPPLEGFPEKGLLQFYIANTDDYGYDEPCKVIYIEDFEKDESKLLSENPYQSEIQENQPFEMECKITYESKEMAVTDFEGEFEEMLNLISDEDEDDFYDAFASGTSRIGGYPSFVQDPVECYEMGEKEILLLQLDVDDPSGLMFGDSGNCQFFISMEDLDNKNFSELAYDWACC